MTNEQIVSEIRNGYSVTDYMQLLYESSLPPMSLWRTYCKNVGRYKKTVQKLEQELGRVPT